MIIVNFENNEEYKKAYGLWQYDYGQVLRIQGLDLPTAVEMHFSLTETGGEAVTRIGITKDGVTDVTIPDSLLEADGASQDYQIYVFIYLATPDSGETTRRITLGVKSRPRPEVFDTPGEEELFEGAVQAVNDAAKRAEEAGKEAIAAAGEARESASQAGKHLADTQALAEQVEINADTVAQGAEKAKELLDQTQEVASNAVISAQTAKQSETAAREAQTAAESAEDAARQYAAGTEADRQEVAENKQSVAQIQSNVARMQADVQADREAVEQTVSEFGQTAQDALTAIGQAQNTAVSAVTEEGQKQATTVQEAGTQAVNEVDTAKTAAVGAVTAEGDKQVGRVREAAAEIVADREQIQQNQADIATLTDKTNTLAPGIVLDARGKQIIISDASEQPFVGLNVYGKSTQVKTTGVNLANGMDNVYKKEQSGQQKPNYCYCWGYSLGGGPLILDKPLKAGTYTFSFYSDTAASVYLAKAPYVTGQFIQYSVNQKVTGDIKNGLQRYFCPFQLTDERDLIGIYSEGYTTCFGGMINFGDKPLPYEPYTGGKPSPSPEYPQKIVSAGDNGSITVEVTGRNLIKPNSYGTYYELPLKANTVVTLMTNGKLSDGGNIKFVATDGSDVWFSIDKGQTRVCRSIGNKDVKGFYNLLSMSAGLEYMFAVGNIKTYTPYVDPQSLTLATPNGLPGIPVATGGNYVDETGQQWICDEIDYENRERIQRIGEYVFDGSESWQTWGVNNETEGITGFYWHHLDKIISNKQEVLNTHSTFRPGAYGGKAEGTFEHIEGKKEEHYLGWSVRNEYLDDVTSDSAAVQSFKKLLGEINAKMLYVQAEPIRISLSPEEIAAYKSLHTYSSTTIVTNDSNAGMSLTYTVDTKKYVDKKIAAISAAMIGG